VEERLLNRFSSGLGHSEPFTTEDTEDHGEQRSRSAYSTLADSSLATAQKWGHGGLDCSCPGIEMKNGQLRREVVLDKKIGKKLKGP
jgi:hypothetical protein